jgi:hypothetical protein
MIWTFRRDAGELRCEVAHDTGDGCYRIIVTNPDGSRNVERVDSPTALVARTLAVMQGLHADGWRLP